MLPPSDASSRAMLELQSTYKINPTTGWPTTSGRATRWFAPTLEMLPLAPQRCRVRNPLNGAIAELSPDQYAVLAACEGCLLLDDHLVIVERKLDIGTGDRNTIARLLEHFAARGLLLSLDELVRRFGSSSSASVASSAGVVIRTCDRPALLGRALASAAVLETHFGTRSRYLILDDSRDAASRVENQRAIADEPRLDCDYYDLSQRSALERDLRLSFQSFDQEIAWLLGPPAPGEATYGRPVNLALLLTAGRRFLMLDDDALLEPRRPPLTESGFAVSSDADELFCYAAQEALLSASAPFDLDPISAHLEYLGKPVSQVWERLAAGSSGPAVVNLRSEDAARFAAGARILFTQNHALGDPGSALFPYHLLSLPPTSRRQVMEGQDWASYAFRDRFNWRGQPRFRLATTRPLTFTTLTGVDNSVVLPPTVRSHRNEDLLFGQMAQYAHSNGWIVDLPWALPHWRDPPKQWLDASVSVPQEPVHFVLDYLDQQAKGVASDLPGRRLETMGALLTDLGCASDQRLADMLEAQVADVASRSLFSIETQLDDPSVPAQWKETIRPWLKSPALAMDPVRLRERRATPASVRELVMNYGRALVAWPKLWSWVRERPSLTG